MDALEYGRSWGCATYAVSRQRGIMSLKLVACGTALITYRRKEDSVVLTKEQVELDIRAMQIKQLTAQLEASQAALRVATSDLVEAKVHLGDVLWAMADIELAKVKFEQKKGKAWRYLRGDK